jgi:hypothetical protein
VASPHESLACSILLVLNGIHGNVVVLHRLPKDFVLHGKTPWQARTPKASTVARCTAALKRSGARFRAGVARSVRTGGDTPRTVDMPSSQLTALRLGRGQPGSGQLGSLGGLRNPMSVATPDGTGGIATGSRMLDTLSTQGEQAVLRCLQGVH